MVPTIKAMPPTSPTLFFKLTSGFLDCLLSFIVVSVVSPVDLLKCIDEGLDEDGCEELREGGRPSSFVWAAMIIFLYLNEATKQRCSILYKERFVTICYMLNNVDYKFQSVSVV